MNKIALDGDFNFSDDQLARLTAIGQLDKLAPATTDEEWLQSVQGYNVICTWGDHVVANLDKLENVLVTYPYTELGSFDSVSLAKKNVFVANARGGNKKSITEWTLFMILALYRQFPTFLRTTEQHPFTSTESLEGKQALVVGSGTIGSEVAARCESFGMVIEYFHRGDDFEMKMKDADIVINALNCNTTSKNLMNKDVFLKMKEGSYYVTFARPYTSSDLIVSISCRVFAAPYASSAHTSISPKR